MTEKKTDQPKVDELKTRGFDLFRERTALSQKLNEVTQELQAVNAEIMKLEQTDKSV